MTLFTDTIAAIATPQGKGGVGIVRLSGPKTKEIATTILRRELSPRIAQFGNFYHCQNNSASILDSGIALFFKSPNSFTGEDVLELQGHGGPVIMDSILKEVLELGARLAKPGEFSERAFLNDKIDLIQAEAIADLIDSQSETAAQSALHSLQGKFSKRIQELIDELIQLRVYVESAIDFPEEEIDFLVDSGIANQLDTLIIKVRQVFKEARQGALLKDGMTVVIAGHPNAGKSSLLNQLSGRDSAIVTPIAGTTRDVLREYIQIDGMPLHIIDTAGLRESPDEVEKEGIRRAWQEIHQADLIVLVVDGMDCLSTDPRELWPEFSQKEANLNNIVVVKNKCDLTKEPAGSVSKQTIPKHSSQQESDYTIINLSAKTGLGVDCLRQYLKQTVGYESGIEGQFIARRRHLDALRRAENFILQAQGQLSAGELLAEDLRFAQLALSEITGAFTSDDLLGEIFSSFCIGK